MTQPKTQKNDASVEDFITSVEDEAKRQDCFALVKIFEEVIGEKGVMWGTAIIGFDSYHYKSERSSQQGDWLLVGFSPRKQNLTIYIPTGFDDYAAQLEKLGKHKTSTGGCLYIKRLSDIDIDVLKFIIKDSAERTRALHS
jgi:hypothetical protein